MAEKKIERESELQLTYAYMNIIALYSFEHFSNDAIFHKNYVFKIQQWQLEIWKIFALTIFKDIRANTINILLVLTSRWINVTRKLGKNVKPH